MMTEISAESFSGINGASMSLFKTGFRIFISAIIISESAFDLGYLISQTEVYHAIRQAGIGRFMGLVVLGMFFTYWNISEPADKIWKL